MARPDQSPQPDINDPPVDPRKPPDNARPGSHSTGGAKDHTQPYERGGAK